MRYLVSARGGSASAAVEAPNWLAALGVGLDQLGDVGAIDRLACEVLMNGTVLARDARTGHGYVVRPVPADEVEEDEEDSEKTELISLAQLARAEKQAGSSGDEDSDLVLGDSDEEPAPLDFGELPTGSVEVLPELEQTDFALPLPVDHVVPLEPSDELEPLELDDPSDADLETGLFHAMPARLSDIAAAHSAGEACESALSILQAAVPTESGSVLLQGADAALRFEVVSGPARDSLIGTVVPPRAGIVGFCLSRGTGIIVHNPSSDPRFYGKVDQRTGYVTRSVLCVPLRTGGESMGCIQLLNPAPGKSFATGDLALAQDIAEALSQRLLQERLG